MHFLHIGKTGGSAIKHALKKYKRTENYIIKLHGHDITLKDIPRGEYITFVLRDPISRFVSGFYSRKRKGMPRYYVEWDDIEKEVFGIFETPGELARALADSTSPNHSLALKAMRNIVHLERYQKWYIDFDYFHSRLEDIFFIGFQETLNDDFQKLLNLLKINDKVELPSDEVLAHKNPQYVDKRICESGESALREWYSDDYKFLSMCKRIMNNGHSDPDSGSNQ